VRRVEEEYINEEKARFPIQIKEQEIRDLVKKAWALEWIAQHHMNKYHAAMANIWAILEEVYSLDSKYHVYTIASEIPTIYYVKPLVNPIAPKEEFIV
jgi:hypothetical protein